MCLAVGIPWIFESIHYFVHPNHNELPDGFCTSATEIFFHVIAILYYCRGRVRNGDFRNVSERFNDLQYLLDNMSQNFLPSVWLYDELYEPNLSKSSLPRMYTIRNWP